MGKFNLQRIFIFAAGLILLAFLFSALRYFSIGQLAPTRPPWDWKDIFLAQAIIYTWVIILPLIVFFAKRFRFEQRNWWRLLPAHLAAAVFFLLLYRAVYAIFYRIIDPARFLEFDGFLNITLRLFTRNWIADFPIYCFLLSSIYVLDFYRRYRIEQLKSSELKAALVTSQLNALKMQIHPHFLFNTLNSISALMHKDVEAADKMVARLGDFLRLTLENSGDRVVSLKQEMDFVRHYLEIEGVRFQDRLVVKIDIDPATLPAQVPNLILQPIVENAIKHGISQQESVESLTITATRHAADRLRICVADSGPGLPPSNENGNGTKTTGIGLANTRARLRHLYEENYRLEIKNAVPHGVLVTLEIPFETKND